MRAPLSMLRGLWERISIYLPIILMGLLALGTYSLVRNTPMPSLAEPDRPVNHEPDYFMRGFAVRTFDGQGRLKSEVFGAEIQHFPDTDTLEIAQPRIRSFSPQGQLTTATAQRALSNGDGSEVQLFGNAVVVRDASVGKDGLAVPRFEFRGEFLHAFMNTERVRSHLPVQMVRGGDRFSAESFEFDNLDRVAQLQGRVSGVLSAKSAR